jgi:hypothetical protein
MKRELGSMGRDIYLRAHSHGDAHPCTPHTNLRGYLCTWRAMVLRCISYISQLSLEFEPK